MLPETSFFTADFVVYCSQDGGVFQRSNRSDVDLDVNLPSKQNASTYKTKKVRTVL